MDHHCPWFGGCVGKYNQKVYRLFLIVIFIIVFFHVSLLCNNCMLINHYLYDTIIICINIYKMLIIIEI